MTDRHKPGHAKRGAAATASVQGVLNKSTLGYRFKGIGLSDRTIEALVDCSIDAPERLLFMEEAALKNIPGVGKVGQSEIAAYRAKYRV